MYQTIYNYLCGAGLTHAGALGVMGNLQAESGCEACRLQGDFDLSRTRSKAYAAKVDSGEMSVHIFSRDSYGWGLAQWTHWSRKEALFYYARGRGKSIADEEAQLGFLLKELRENYFSLYQFLCNTTEMYTATKRVCEEFERPAINNVQARYAMAQAIEKDLKKSQEPIPVASEYWPPRTIDKGMAGPDVEVLQAVLKSRGYSINYVSGKFDGLLESEVKKCQSANGLAADGVCGPLTWAAVLRRE